MMRLLGIKVRRLREQANLTQSELATKLGLSDQSKGVVSEIESGRKIPRTEVVLKLAIMFEVSTDYLLRDDIAIKD
ncbi:helix-turn-helix domain-containing protein [Oscillochloris sp. ZM17-4]|uniref:helix-turn-helix domain-containing protein n=1 Tax=Oscillochloris sp. ZM17-4 TaxID=2866714 RepID=UPI001C739279|nr:helix-turn-helix transcriptional regulator [Oscillochloris sp. ZM17-4]MBX0329027.1 helix-turn-helix domain-containing protein [Oscillochloris sp. ZM17-4]